jgi:hypothetical protein
MFQAALSLAGPCEGGMGAASTSAAVRVSAAKLAHECPHLGQESPSGMQSNRDLFDGRLEAFGDFCP